MDGKTLLYAQSITDTVREPLVVLDEDLRIVMASRAFYREFQLSRQLTEGQLIYDVDNHQWDIPELRQMLETIFPLQETIDDFTLHCRFGTTGEKILAVNARRIAGEGARSGLILLAIEDITERGVALKELEEKSATLDALLESIPEGIMITDAFSVVKRVSRYAGELFGLPPEKLLGTDEPMRLGLLEFYWPSGQRIEGPGDLPLSKAAVTGETYTNLEVNLKLDGVTRTLSANASPIRDSQGAIVGAIGGWRDVTDRKLAEQAIAQREMRFRLATEAAGFGVFEWHSVTDEPIWENRRIYEIFGLSPGDKPVSFDELVREFLHRDDLQGFEESIGESMRSGSPFNIECRIRRRSDKQWRWVKYYSRFEMSREGKAFRLLGFIADITDYKVAQEALKVERERLQVIFDNLSVGLIFLNSSGEEIQTFNHAAMSIHGFQDPSEFLLHITEYPKHFDVLNGENKPIPLEEWVIPTAVRGVYLKNWEAKLVRKDSGQVKYISASAFPITTDGIVNNILLQIVDITGQKRVEAALQSRTEELMNANRDLESFSYSVSHDLQAPLRTISGFAQVLAEDYSGLLDDQGRDFLRRIDDGVSKMQQLINDMLSLGRIGRLELNREDVDLSTIARNYLQELLSTEPERQAEVIIEDNVHAYVDPQLMHLAMENLLRNAWKFTAKRECARIEFGVAVKNG